MDNIRLDKRAHTNSCMKDIVGLNKYGFLTDPRERDVNAYPLNLISHESQDESK